MDRPGHLPDFRDPPLNEVVLGVQFFPPPTYQQIHAGEVWALFRDKYQTVQEQPALPPTFETFGLPTSSINMTQLKLFSGAQHDRFWFLTNDGSELIQFQQDRLLHNWRKVDGLVNAYPRFERMVEEFEDEVSRLEKYFSSLAPKPLQLTQCEITYVNHIGSGSKEPLVVSEWLRALSFPPPLRADDFSLTFRQNIYDENGKPHGRLGVEATTAAKGDGTQLILLNISVRGAPKEATIRSAIDFMGKGRDLIVTQFAQLTTDAAHALWGRVK